VRTATAADGGLYPLGRDGGSSSLKVAVGFAFTGAIVGEFVASSRGLGYLLDFAQSTFNAALTLALVLLIMVFVLLLLGIAGLIERRLLRWR
jgi:NitT/TauT family transport system permease protein